MVGIFAILIAEILFSFILLIWKDLRKRGVDTLSNLSLLAFSVPFFVILWFFLSGEHVFNPTPAYFWYVGLWLVPVFLYNVGTIYLTKYQGLLELNTYKLGFSTLIAIGVDVLFLNTRYSFLTFIAIVLFFLCAYVLTKNRFESKIPLIQTIAIILFLSILQVFEYAIYKKALLVQSTPLFNVVIAQCALALLFFLFGYQSLLKNMQKGVIRPYHIVAITLLFIPFAILETIGLSQLPVAIVILATVFPLVIYSLYDIGTTEIKISYQTICAFVGVIIGIILLSV